MIGLMGGTFSPIHYGHLLMCESIREEFDLEKIIFMPAKQPPHKNYSEIIDANDRFEMVKLAVKENPYFEVSDLELRREGASFTVDTLKTLKEIFGPHKELALIIGADSLVQFETWKNYREIFELAVVIVASRPHTENDVLDRTILNMKEKYNARILKSSEKAYDYASSDIRERVKNGYSIKYRVPADVERYILEKGLYRDVSE